MSVNGLSSSALLAASLICIGITGPSAHAQDTFYLGAGLGQAKVKDTCADLPSQIVACNDTDTTWRVFGGIQLNKNFALELGYADWGKVDASGGGVSVQVEGKAWDVVAVGILPLDPWIKQASLFGKLGYARWDVTSSDNAAMVLGSVQDNGWGLTFGVGAQFNFTKTVGMRVEWQNYNNLEGSLQLFGSKVDVYSDVDVLSASVLVMF